MKPGYICVWEFLAAPGKVEEFKRLYGPEGDWVQLFRRAPGYIRSELHQDQANPQRFVTVDYWESQAAGDAFRKQFLHDYEDLDVRCEQYTVKERELGRFTPLG
ncbi:MAG TPA: antibiotic biosynthesis monooxygenase family protein [Gammaproteobacteria bacterium]|nr:antibiotic biosynthesis monooxygenase family protein [Gammaproteobacteria bacterium]